MHKHTFTTGERLKSRKEIGRLFSRQSNSFGQYPLRLVWMEMEERKSEYPVQFTVSVPKRKFKKAVHRNRIRRLIQEAYRLNKHHLYKGIPEDAPQVAWMIIFVGDKEISFAKTQKCMGRVISRFHKEWTFLQSKKPITND